MVAGTTMIPRPFMSLRSALVSSSSFARFSSRAPGFPLPQCFSRYGFAGLLIGLLAIVATGWANAPEIRLEKNQQTQTAFVGVAADGTSVLGMEITLPQAAGPIQVVPPKVGSISTVKGRGELKNNQLTLGTEGKAVIIYRPPPYLSDKILEPRTGSSSPSFSLPVTLALNWRHKDAPEGMISSSSISFQICRSPVVLIHGLAEGASSLASLSAFLGARRFDTLCAEYFAADGGGTLERQAEKLQKHVAELVKSYFQQGFKITRVDLVAHCLGGLLARHFLLKLAGHGKECPVRKLVMIGTPNHGIAWNNKTVNRLFAEYRNAGKANVANQIYSGHPFLATLNSGESAGRHLHSDVQHAVIVGVRKRYQQHDWAGSLVNNAQLPAADDGMVTRASAFLNGVKPFILEDVIHTSDPALSELFPQDEPMNRSAKVAGLIHSLLLQDIAKDTLHNTDFIVRKGEGDVFHRQSDNEDWKKIPKFPISMRASWGSLRTSSGKALIEFATQGQTWGTIALAPHTEITIDFASPEQVRALVRKGNARFVSGEVGGRKFEVLLGNDSRDWTQFSPRARIHDLDTDFTVSTGDKGDVVHSLSGRVIVTGTTPEGTSKMRLLKTGKALALSPDGEMKNAEPPPKGWWEDSFYAMPLALAAGSEPDTLDDSWTPLSPTDIHLRTAESYRIPTPPAPGVLRFVWKKDQADLAVSRALLHFSLDSVKQSGRAVEAAFLELTALSEIAAGQTMKWFALNAPWEAANGSLAWTKLPAADRKGLWSTFALPGKGTKKIRFDITTLVWAWLADQKPNHGILVSTSEEGTGPFALTVGSPDHAAVTAHPRLLLKLGPAPATVAAVPAEPAPETGGSTDSEGTDLREAFSSYIACYTRLQEVMQAGKDPESLEVKAIREEYEAAQKKYQGILTNTRR
jgi:pimeloyl-ACP methyl ester carboxylesterase